MVVVVGICYSLRHQMSFFSASNVSPTASVLAFLGDPVTNNLPLDFRLLLETHRQHVWHRGSVSRKKSVWMLICSAGPFQANLGVSVWRQKTGPHAYKSQELSIEVNGKSLTDFSEHLMMHQESKRSLRFPQPLPAPNFPTRVNLEQQHKSVETGAVSERSNRCMWRGWTRVIVDGSFLLNRS